MLKKQDHFVPFADIPITRKPTEVRMRRGKGNPIPQRIVHGTTIEILKKPFLSIFLLIVIFINVHLDLDLGPLVTACDGGRGSPSVAAEFHPAGEPVTPPEEPPVPQPAPQPVIIPRLDQPLLSDAIRGSILYNRYLLLNVGGNEALQRMVATIDAQILVEQYVESALVDDGFSPESIIGQYREIRGTLHSPQGELLSPQTYASYVTQIQEHGTRSSIPYQRVMRAIQNYNILLERRTPRVR